jgi:hypothetical protein
VGLGHNVGSRRAPSVWAESSAAVCGTPHLLGRPRTPSQRVPCSPCTPALAAAMASWLGMPCRATAEEHSAMEPPPLVIMRFTADLVGEKTHAEEQGECAWMEVGVLWADS